VNIIGHGVSSDELLGQLAELAHLLPGRHEGDSHM
jgi:hypothetical protein